MLRRLVLSAPILGLLMLAIAACGSEPGPPPPMVAFVRTSPPPPPPAPVAAEAPTPTEGGQPTQDGGGTPVTVELVDNDGRGPYSYEPADFSFSVGEKVTFTLTAEAVYHTFTIDGTSVDVDVEVDEVREVTFTFDEPGTYSLICIPHELNGMVGVITVQ